MEFEIISTGDEVITGIINDTNATWLSQQLLDLGVQPRFRHTVGDDIRDITALLEERSKYADFIFVNGGLGPTTDDNTSVAAAAAAHVKLVRHPEWVQKIEAWHEKRGRTMSPTNLKQADLPEGAVMIDNPNGTACGFHVQINRALCFFTPGVPSEFKPMITDSILPIVKSRLPHTDDTVLKRFFITGMSESYMQERVNTLALPEELIIGYRASYPVMELKIISHHASRDRESMEAAAAQIRKLLAGVLVAEDNFDLPAMLGRLLGDTKVHIYDEVSAGLLGMQLSKALNIEQYYAARNSKNRLPADFSGISDEDCLIELLREDDTQSVQLVFKKSRALLSDHVRIKLNTTLKNKVAEAYCMAAEFAILRLLQGKELPQLQLGEISKL